MGTIKIPQAFKAKNDILRTLLHKGNPNEVLTLRLWGLTNNSIGGRAAIASITSGWNHKQEKNVVSGQVTEVLKVNNDSPITAAIMKAVMGCDIVYEDNTFDRYTIQGKAQLNHMTGEWRAELTPSFQDTEALYVAP